MASSPIELLRRACNGNLSTNSSLSSDGRTLNLNVGASTARFDATASQKLTLDDGRGGTKEVSYTLASIYLQLLNLNESVLQYRKVCEAANAGDPVKILDKTSITKYFFDGAAGAGKVAAEPAADDGDRGDAMEMSDEDLPSTAVQFSKVHDEGRHRRSDKDHRRRHRSDSRGRDKDSSSGKHHRHDRSRSKHRKDEDDERKKSSGKAVEKSPLVPITNAQLVANLSTIVDKRDTTATPATPAAKDDKESKEEVATPAATPADSRETSPEATSPAVEEGLTPEEAEKKRKEKEDADRELLMMWLSPEGFQVNSPDVAAAIEADREAVRGITALEIPVGDSASILRAGAGGEVVEKSTAEGLALGGSSVKKRDFARVLEIYQDVVVEEEKAKRNASSTSGKKRPPPPSGGHRGKNYRSSSGRASAGGGTPTKVDGNPVIVVPNAMTSAITMINAGRFLGKEAVFVPRALAMRDPASTGKRGGTISVTRRLNQRLGGSEITYDIIDNPTTRLKKDDWNRVVAVICQGASWQFKGWRYSDPVDLFSRTFGFYVGIEGANIPTELRGWNVKIGKVSRDRRGLDNVCLASFWNGLEEFMAVHKQELIRS